MSNFAKNVSHTMSNKSEHISDYIKNGLSRKLKNLTEFKYLNKISKKV